MRVSMDPQDLSVWIVQHSILGENILTGNQDQPSVHFPTMEGLEASKVDFCLPPAIFGKHV